jgi:rod shape-determining protein MreC
MVVRRYSSKTSDATRPPESRVVEAILSRYRNLLVLAIVIVAQLLLLAWQVRTNQDVRLIRVWAVTAVTPMAGVVEAVRRNTIGFLEDYFILLDVREQNRKLHDENSRLKMENIYYRNQLSTAERARALSAFQLKTPSKTAAARIIGNGTATSAQVVFIDRGSTSGVEKGMAVVTPDGVVGKVISVYPLASQVLLITDPTFAVGVESQKGHVHGSLQCSGTNCMVDYVQNEEKVDGGEWFYTSGEDRIFPKGFPVGTASSVKPGQFMKEIHLNLSGSPGGADEVLVVLEGVHQQIPDVPPSRQRVAAMLPPPPSESVGDQPTPKMATQADQIKQKYIDIGKQQGHEYGAHNSNIPNFNQKPPQGQPPSTPPPAAANGSPSAANQTARPAPLTVPKLPPKTPAVTEPTVLGARPQGRPAAPVQKPAIQNPDTTDRPVLPLGAPRRKPATPAAPQQ